MMRQCLIILIGGTACCVGCGDDTRHSTITPARSADRADVRQHISLSARTYSYKAFSTSGSVLVQGTVSLASSTGSTVVGNWTLSRTASDIEIDVGPQIGSGKLVGEIDASKQIVLRTTETSDYDVILVGTQHKNDIFGEWQFRDDAGVVNSGKFEALLLPE